MHRKVCRAASPSGCFYLFRRSRSLRGRRRSARPTRPASNRALHVPSYLRRKTARSVMRVYSVHNNTIVAQATLFARCRSELGGKDNPNMRRSVHRTKRLRRIAISNQSVDCSQHFSTPWLSHGVGVQLSSWINSLYQLVSQVVPLSVENACSHFATTFEPLGFTVHVKRAITGMPL